MSDLLGSVVSEFKSIAGGGIAVFTPIYGFFVAFEKVTSKAFREEASAWLQHLEFRGKVPPTSEHVRTLFIKFFGARQWSIRCVRNTALWTIGSLTITAAMCWFFRVFHPLLIVNSLAE